MEYFNIRETFHALQWTVYTYVIQKLTSDI